MPTNVGPEYKAAEARYRMASSPEAQLAALQEMLSTIPKHKGTEKMQADIKRRISEHKREASQRKKGGHRSFFVVERAEGGQTVLVGPTNSGKSLLLSRLTNADPEVAAYPYTTRLPAPGMMPFEDVMLQLIDLPAVSSQSTEPWVLDVIRRADVILLVVDAGDDDVLAAGETILELLGEKGIEVVPAWGGGSEDDQERVLPKRALVVANKVDLDGARDRAGLLRELYEGRFPVVEVSAVTGAGLEELRCAVYRAADVIRVYTKAPGRHAQRTRPFLLPTGSTVLEAARTVHADFAAKLKYARIWGNQRFDGQMVRRHDVLRDGDMLEFHI
jgi:hypothetical protein